MTHRLSKSRFLSGLQCHKKLWIETHHPERIPPPSPADERIFQQGDQIGELAREEFPNGLLIEADHTHIPDALRQTDQALTHGVPVLFEAAFIYNNVLVRADILEQNADGSWNLIEVKSSTRVKDEHLSDVAIQQYVIEGAGLTMQQAAVMHINTGCIYPDLSDLLTITDVSAAVQPIRQDIPALVTQFHQVVNQTSEPEVPIGQHCEKPYTCPLKDYCWQHVPDYSIFTVPRLNWDTKERLMADDIFTVIDIPESFPLSDSQQEYVECVQSETAAIDWAGIQRALSHLEYPLYFLDFETDNPAIPRFDGMHPYEQFPFQYSCHILQKDGTLSHTEYLHTDPTDPRLPLAEHLVTNIEKSGSVIAYNAGFEKRVLTALRNRFSGLQTPLQGIIDRLWDQLVIFRTYYTDYRFQGSNSIKSVLPVLVPELSYADLDIASGDVAQVIWNEMLQTTDAKTKKGYADHLRAYCQQDTLAMVRIHEYLLDQCF